MIFKKHASSLILTSSVLLTLACAHNAPQEAKTESLVKTSKAAAEVGGGEYVVVNFAEGTKTLTVQDKEKLRKLATQSPHHGKIAKYEVLAWADREYPTDGQKATTSEARLAEDRADNIKDYLKKDLNTTETVTSHNMAKRPGVFSEVFKSTDYKLKNTFEATGAAPGDQANALEKLESKASKAVILVKYE
jgi:hypothetical protein